MNPVEFARNRHNAIIAEIQAIVDGCTADGNRDFNAEEKSRIDDLYKRGDEAREGLERAQKVTAPVLAPEQERSWQADRIGDAPAVHVDPKKRKYSLLRAFSNDPSIDRGFEREISAELARLNNNVLDGSKFYVPLGANPESLRMMNWNQERAATPVLDPTSGVMLAPNTMETPLIEILRPRQLIRRLPVTFHDGVHGNFYLPRQTATSRPQNTYPGGPAVTSETAQYTEKVQFTPHAITAISTLDLTFRYQAGYQMAQLLNNDMFKRLGTTSDEKVFFGTGTNEPLGITNDPAILLNSAGLALGGLAPTNETFIDMETAVSTKNADIGAMGYVTNAAVRGKLKKTKVTGGDYPVYVWGPPVNGKGDGSINDYAAWVSNIIPSANTTSSPKTGGASSGLSSIIFGAWEMLHVATWEAVEVFSDPYTQADTGKTRYIIRLAMDCGVEHPEGFAVINDAKTA